MSVSQVYGDECLLVKFMVMSVCLVLKFASGLKGLRGEEKRSETIGFPVVLV